MRGNPPICAEGASGPLLGQAAGGPFRFLRSSQLEPLPGLCKRVCHWCSERVGCSEYKPQPPPAGRERWRLHSKKISITTTKWSPKASKTPPVATLGSFLTKMLLDPKRQWPRLGRRSVVIMEILLECKRQRSRAARGGCGFYSEHPPFSERVRHPRVHKPGSGYS